MVALPIPVAVTRPGLTVLIPSRFVSDDDPAHRSGEIVRTRPKGPDCGEWHIARKGFTGVTAIEFNVAAVTVTVVRTRHSPLSRSNGRYPFLSL